MRKMRKIATGVFLALVLSLAMFSGASALNLVPAQVTPGEVSVKVPEVAIKKSPVIDQITPGTLEKIVFIHYAGGKIKVKGSGPSCYRLLGSKWTSLPISYIVDSQLENVDSGAIYASAETWDEKTNQELFNNEYSVGEADWDDDFPDGHNEYSLGNYPEPNVIAVTVIWTGMRIGKKQREIIEYDVMFNSDYGWGDAEENPEVMDLQNIATHETGHGLGLGDVYQNVCSEVTMYGYSDYGETNKRTLEPADIAGLLRLYP